MMSPRLRIIEMTAEDAGRVPLCGCKDPGNEGYRHKFQWIRKRMSEGLKAKVIRTPDEDLVGYIEYVPGERAWMAGKALFLKNGFEEVDKALPDFTLLARRFRKAAPTPSFKGQWDKKLKKFAKSLTIISCGQCPFGAKMVDAIARIARDRYAIEPRIVGYNSYRQAQNAPWPYAVSGVIYNGRLVADHPISGRRFQNIMEKEMAIVVRKRCRSGGNARRCRA